MEPYILLKFLPSNKLDMISSQIYSWNETVQASDCFSVHNQGFFHCNVKKT